MKFIEPRNRKQLMLPQCLDDYVTADHPVRVIDTMVEEIYKSNKELFTSSNSQTDVGRPAYHKTLFVKLFLYGFINRIRSSRRLEQEAGRNFELIWLLGELVPDHWTISNFRKENGELIEIILKLVKEFLKKNGYITGKRVAIDGTKIKANSNRDMLTSEKINRKQESIKKEVEDYFRILEENDRREDIIEEYEQGDEESINVFYIKKIAELQKKLEELEEAKKELEHREKKAISPTDPECNLMKSREGKIPAYNVQMTVDSENKMISDVEVRAEENDYQLMEVMLESYREDFGENPEESYFDAGYNNPDMIERQQTKCYVANVENKRDREEIKFTYDTEKDEVICSEGKRLVLKHKNKKKHNSYANVYQGIECEGCKLQERCKKSKRGRIYHRYVNQDFRDKYKKEMEGREAREKLKKRKAIIEHVFGTIKIILGKVPLLLRGIKKVSTEMRIYALGYNLIRLLNIEKRKGMSELIEKIREYEWKLA